MHQIRVHLSGVLDVPIVGDKVYNLNPLHEDRQLLHSYQITLPNPVPTRPNLTSVTYTAPPPEDFYEFLEGKELITATPQYFDIFYPSHSDAA